MSRLKVFLIILFFAILAPRAYRIIQFMDLGETIVPHTPGKCNKIKGIDKDGSEDMDVVPGTDMVLISSGMVFGPQTMFPGRKGRILFYDLSEKQAEAKPATFKNYKGVESLNPHGISVWKDGKTGKVLLFVVNHRNMSGVDLVERFEVDVKTKTLTYLESISDEKFNSLNDITAAGEREFYFTNHHKYTPGSLLAKMEGLLNIRNGEVGHYSAEGVSLVDVGLLLPNGINQSPDKRFLYVAHIGDDEIRTYEIQAGSTPKLVQKMPAPSIVDNISVDPVTGDLWLGCHPIGWKIMHYMEHQETATAPSQVLKVSTKAGLLEDFTEVYVDDGRNLIASTVAVYHKGQLLIGSINHNAMHCIVQAF